MGTRSQVMPMWQPLVTRLVTQTEASPQARDSWRIRLYSVILFILAGVHTLLPVERGFPVIRLAEGYPVTVTILVSLLCFLCLLIESGGLIFTSRTKNGYLYWQCLFAAALVLAAVTSPEQKPALFVCLNYSVCFILNFFTLRYVFAHGNRKTLLAIICVVVSAAAVVGLLERLAGYYLPFYKDWFLSFDYAGMAFAMRQTGEMFRALGPLGNPILYAVVLSLALPFTLCLTGYVRWAATGLLCVSILLGTSTTGVLIMGCYVVGLFVNYARKTRVLLLIGWSLAAIAGALAIGSAGSDGFETASPFDRALYGDGKNVELRIQMIEMGIEKVLNFEDTMVLLTGRGLKTSNELVTKDGGSYSGTLDNVWLTIVYEAGVPALIFFILSQIIVLYQLRRFAWTPHWWGILGWSAAGFSFVTIYYATTNFLWVALVAWLWTEERSATERRKVIS